MKLREFETTYPTVFGMLEDVTYDNQLHLNFEFSLPRRNWPRLEAAAFLISEEEREVIAMGDRDEAEVIIKRLPALRPLDRFLNECFEGKFKDIFR